ncbi:hypothetical protein ABZ746_01955 [Streptomyces sp. NPDC020096]
MPEITPAPVRRCPDCDGFPIVAVDTGIRRADGTRTTVKVTCPVCHGTGTAPRRAAARQLLTAGR